MRTMREVEWIDIKWNRIMAVPPRGGVLINCRVPKSKIETFIICRDRKTWRRQIVITKLNVRRQEVSRSRIRLNSQLKFDFYWIFNFLIARYCFLLIYMYTIMKSKCVGEIKDNTAKLHRYGQAKLHLCNNIFYFFHVRLQLSIIVLKRVSLKHVILRKNALL